MDYIIIAILLLIVVFALGRVKKHFKGGGCCGSGGNTIRDKKTLSEPVIGEITLTIAGRTCENCAIRVENALNRLDHVLCKVNQKKKTATVSYTQNVPDSLLKSTVERLGYRVTQIRR